MLHHTFGQSPPTMHGRPVSQDMSTMQRMQSPPYNVALSSKTTMKTGGTYVHVVEALIDIVELAVVRDIFVDLDLALKIVCKVANMRWSER